jgi:hypothetical protein
MGPRVLRDRSRGGSDRRTARARAGMKDSETLACNPPQRRSGAICSPATAETLKDAYWEAKGTALRPSRARCTQPEAPAAVNPAGGTIKT